ncbi:MAG: heme-binding domain-containing protein [Eudoraea sp.]|nr:heme-binding domain-containing protein [Eudoraea sp.]
MLKKIGLVLLVILVIIQFFRPEKNDSNDQTYALAKIYEMPENVQKTLKVACNDCHSNLTKYPWYSKVQPVAWWLNDHIKHGKGDLNFSEFTNMPIAVQNHKFEEIIEMVEEHEMPLPSYTNFGLHPEANLSEEERKMLIEWASAQMNYLKSNYPEDSLVMKRRRPARAN